MKKNLSLMLAAILTCGSMFIACSNDVDNPVIPTPDPIITGEWFAIVNISDYDEDSDEGDVNYILLTFDEDGVITQDVYTGNTKESLRHWERRHRHGLYTTDNAAHTLTIEDISDDPSVFSFSFDKGQLAFSNIYKDDADGNLPLTLHRPSKAEKDLLAVYHRSLKGDDYTGKWFNVQEENGQRTYVMLDFTEDSGLKTIRYTMDGDQCIRTEYTQYYNEYIDYEDEDEDEQVLEIHNPADYMQSDYYWWEVDGNTLTLEKEENENEVVKTYHALTKADAALMAELEKKSKQ